MGMTIDEAIDFLAESKYSPYETPSSDTIDIAINTMHKYQKIKEIVLDDYYLSDYNKIKDIKGVIDGNDD